MATTLHEQSDEELRKKIEENQSALRELRFTFAVTRSVQSPAEFRKKKRDIARMHTILREREMGIASVQPKSDKKKKKK